MAAATPVSPVGPSSVLSDEDLARWHRDGFLLVPGAMSEESVGALKASMATLVDGFDIEGHRSIFTTKEQTRVSDDYFLGSGDKVRFFLEEEVVGDDGKLTRPKDQCINKVGHNLHQLVPAFRAVTFSDDVRARCRSLGFRRPLPVQSMYIFKNSEVGGAVNPHQDGTFLWTEPQTCVGFWWALEDCTQENGCLWVVPGSHQQGVQRHFRRRADGKGTEFEPAEAQDLPTEGAVPVEVPAGTLVLIHGALAHYSAPNRSTKPRPAYAVHIVDGAEGVEYPAANWLQREDGKAFEPLYEAH